MKERILGSPLAWLAGCAVLGAAIILLAGWLAS